MTILKPFIKWAGGKQGLASELRKYFPEDFDIFYEPFVGGGSIFLSLTHPKAVISDQNKWLIDTYLAIRENWQEVANRLDTLRNTKEEFLRIRSIPIDDMDLFQKAAHFVYLNKTCFRGLFRVNMKGQFNVPYGDYKRRYYDPDNLRSVSEYLKKVEIRCGDFEFGIYRVKDDDFIYFDPPYYKLGGYSDFNRYTESKFYEKDHIRFAAVCRELEAKGIRWAVSNSDTPFVRELFRGFHIIKINNRREINLNSKDRDVGELLIVNFPPSQVKQEQLIFDFMVD